MMTAGSARKSSARLRPCRRRRARYAGLISTKVMGATSLSRRLGRCEPPGLSRRDEPAGSPRSEEHTSELQSQSNLVCRLLLEKKKKMNLKHVTTRCAQ